MQLCHEWTDPDSVSKYQNTRVAAKYDQTCKAAMITFIKGSLVEKLPSYGDLKMQ